jgi:hypothetical protein
MTTTSPNLPSRTGRPPDPRPDFQDAVPFKIDGVYCRIIPLTQGQYAIVWASDFEWLRQWYWFAWWSKGSEMFYAVRSTWKDGRCSRVYMHAAIAKRHHIGQVDHVNCIGVDNRRDNLRACTVSQNGANRSQQKNNKCGFKRVNKVGKRYRAIIQKDGKPIHLGYFDTPEEASDAYWEAAKRIFGEFARR